MKALASCVTRRRSRVLAFAGLLLCVSQSWAERYTIPLLAPPGASGDPQGVLRILNATAESGAVEIHAIDDSGVRTGYATFTLNASAAAEFTATDLQSGNAALGLAGGIGTATGDARLEIETDLDIVPMAFVRAADGTLSAMHDTVRGERPGDGSGGHIYEVPVFNLSTETVQASRLRLINPGDSAAAIAIAGRDDTGALASGGGVVMETGYAVDDALPGVPTTGAFTPTIIGGGSILPTGGGTTIVLNDEAYFELSDGTRYTCTAPDGCTIANGTVTAGVVTGRAADAGEVGQFPGECRVGMTLSSGQSCTYPGTADAFGVNARARFLPGPPSRHPHPDRQRDDRRSGVRLRGLAPGRRGVAHRPDCRQRRAAGQRRCDIRIERAGDGQSKRRPGGRRGDRPNRRRTAVRADGDHRRRRPVSL